MVTPLNKKVLLRVFVRAEELGSKNLFLPEDFVEIWKILSENAEAGNLTRLLVRFVEYSSHRSERELNQLKE